ncbi:hypothetical protein [Streptomyces sp. NPDC058092]|uniref:hypothetical protein n=1 Tax=Streptomyces sp. NPDC058092 TaxID=3346336 RepID=UPI0036EE07C1
MPQCRIGDEHLGVDLDAAAVRVTEHQTLGDTVRPADRHQPVGAHDPFAHQTPAGEPPAPARTRGGTSTTNSSAARPVHNRERNQVR